MCYSFMAVHQHLQFKDMDSTFLHLEFHTNKIICTCYKTKEHWFLRAKITFCMQISAKTDRGMVKLSAKVPIRDDVRKQPL